MLEKITQLLLKKKYNLNGNSISNLRLSFYYQHKSLYAVTISTRRYKTPHFVCNFEAFERGLWLLYHHHQPTGCDLVRRNNQLPTTNRRVIISASPRLSSQNTVQIIIMLMQLPASEQTTFTTGRDRHVSREVAVDMNTEYSEDTLLLLSSC